MTMHALTGSHLKQGSERVIPLLSEAFSFGRKQILSCLFPGFIFTMLILSNLIKFSHIPRYDFLLAMCFLMQACMYFFKLESGRELLVITMFHLLGLSMEIFKVSKGSWYYPEFAYTKIGAVPFYSGFMYASVGSYVCQAWKRFDVKLEKWPGLLASVFISTAIYLNFFTHHFIYDFRWILTLLLIIVFWKTKMVFKASQVERKMPVVFCFLLLGFFIWIGENMATFFGAWKYAYQHDGWKMVSLGKISSWFLLVVLSIVIVAQLKMLKNPTQGSRNMTGNS